MLTSMMPRYAMDIAGTDLTDNNGVPAMRQYGFLFLFYKNMDLFYFILKYLAILA